MEHIQIIAGAIGMPTKLTDVSAEYLELVRERGYPDALAVYFPAWAPKLAFIEHDGDASPECVERRWVTDLMPWAPRDTSQLKLRFPAAALELPEPPLARASSAPPLLSAAVEGPQANVAATPSFVPVRCFGTRAG